MTTGMKHLAAYQANLLDYNAAKDRECNYIGNQIRAARKSLLTSELTEQDTPENPQ